MMARIMQSHYAKGGRNARRVNRQLLKVLYATDMPSVLTEIGFMSNARELAYMNSEKGQNELARMLCDAVKEYVSHINRMSGDGLADVAPPKQAQPAPAPKPVEPEKPVKPAEPAKPVKPVEPAKPAHKPEQPKPEQMKPAPKPIQAEGYTIQVLASNKKISTSDAAFKSYRQKVKCYIGAGALKYKYCYGEFSTRAEAQRNLVTLRRTFADAFVVHYRDGEIVK